MSMSERELEEMRRLANEAHSQPVAARYERTLAKYLLLAVDEVRRSHAEAAELRERVEQIRQRFAYGARRARNHEESYEDSSSSMKAFWSGNAAAYEVMLANLKVLSQAEPGKARRRNETDIRGNGPKLVYWIRSKRPLIRG